MAVGSEVNRTVPIRKNHRQQNFSDFTFPAKSHAVYLASLHFQTALWNPGVTEVVSPRLWR